MHAYVDQNFLIYCIGNPAWRQAVLNAHRSGAVGIVLSPWHFYEYGNAHSHSETEDVIKFAEELEPYWTMVRADLQLFEFWVVWRQIWESSKDTVDPVGTLPDIAAVLSKVHYNRTAHVTIREYVDAFSVNDALDGIRAVMDENAKVAEANQQAYVQGRFNKSTRILIELNHLAVQRARLELGDDNPDNIYVRAHSLLSQQPIATQFRCFVDWQCLRYLKCYETEGGFSEDLYFNLGQLDRNRFVDREHASIAIPYCQYFVTSDKKLINSCNRVKAKLPFPTAEVMKGEDFITLLTRP